MEQTGAVVNVQEGAILKGFLILMGSFFTMPIKTLKITAQELREVGSKGKIDIGSTNIPHLTWLEIAGHLVISITVIVIVVIGLVMGLLSLKDIRYSVTSALGGLILYPILGILAAIAADWLMAIGLEIIGLWTGIANDIRKIRSVVEEKSH